MISYCEFFNILINSINSVNSIIDIIYIIDSHYASLKENKSILCDFP